MSLEDDFQQNPVTVEAETIVLEGGEMDDEGNTDVKKGMDIITKSPAGLRVNNMDEEEVRVSFGGNKKKEGSWEYWFCGDKG